MNITKSNSHILGLNKPEIKILNCIFDKKEKISEISKQTDIPRTSLYYMLDKLHSRGFIIKNKINKKLYWSLDNNFKKTITDGNSNEKNNYTEVVSKNSEIKIFKGVKDLENIFWDILKIPPKERVRGFQPTPSISEVTRKVPTEDIVKFNKEFKNKQFISEGIVHEGSLEAIKNNMSEDNAKKLFESFGGRSSDTAKIPEDHMQDVYSEIYIYYGKVAIVNWKEEFAVLIGDENVFKLLLEMFKSTKYLMDKYNQNEKIAKKLIDL